LKSGLLTSSARSHLLGLAGYGEEKFEFWWEFVFGVKSIGEVNSANSAVGVDLHSISKGLAVVQQLGCTYLKVSI